MTTLTDKDNILGHPVVRARDRQQSGVRRMTGMTHYKSFVTGTAHD